MCRRPWFVACSCCLFASKELTSFRLPQRLNWIFPSCWLLRCLRRFAFDVSGLLISPMFKGQAVQEAAAWSLKIWPIGSPETSVSNHLTPRNNPADGRIRLICYFNYAVGILSISDNDSLSCLYQHRGICDCHVEVIHVPWNQFPYTIPHKPEVRTAKMKAVRCFSYGCHRAHNTSDGIVSFV